MKKIMSFLTALVAAALFSVSFAHPATEAHTSFSSGLYATVQSQPGGRIAGSLKEFGLVSVQPGARIAGRIAREFPGQRVATGQNVRDYGVAGTQSTPGARVAGQSVRDYGTC